MPTPVSKHPADVRAQARLLLRQWLTGTEDEVLAAIDKVGRQAIHDAANATGRLDRNAAHAASAGVVLGELQALADTFAAPPPAPKRTWFGSQLPAPAPAPVAANLDSLVASLARERDNVTRARIGLETDLARLREADAGLEQALELVRACALAVEAAARELFVGQPTRAAFLRDAATARLLGREQDVLTQAAVTRQGILALRLVADGQDVLAQAIDRARDTSIAALRTALAARQAVGGSQDLIEQARALDRTVEAARQAPTSRGDVQRALDDAMAQVRRAMDAAQGATRDPRSTP